MQEEVTLLRYVVCLFIIYDVLGDGGAAILVASSRFIAKHNLENRPAVSNDYIFVRKLKISKYLHVLYARSLSL